MPAPVSYRPGTQLGPFTIVGELGRGGMGLVLHVRDPSGRELALKLINLPGANPKSLARFRREGEIAASLRHSGLVRVHDQGNLGQQAYISYELVPGGQTLQSALQVLDQEQLLRLVNETSNAVGYAHSQGVIHRDLKPANVLVDALGHARVTDFGLAHAVGLERLTRTGALVGTPHAMAPEQIAGDREQFGPPTDVWALGVMLYRVLTGEDPFLADTLPALAARVISSPPTPPRKLNPEVSRELEAVCLRALEKEPDARFPDANAFAAALEAARAGESPKGRGRGKLAGIVAVLAGVATAAVVWAVATGGPEVDPVSPEPAPSAPAKPTPAQTALRARIRAVLVQDDPVRLVRDLRGLDGDAIAADPTSVALLDEAQASWASRLEFTEGKELPKVPTLRAQEETLTVLVALHRLLPPDAQPFPGSEQLANRVLFDMLKVGGRDGFVGVSLMDRLIDMGLRVNNVTLSAELFEFWNTTLRVNLGAGGTTREDCSRLLVAAAKLDLAFLKGISTDSAHELQGMIVLSDDPWTHYTRDRLNSRLTRDARSWSYPDTVELGPVHHVEMTRLVALGKKKAKQVAILETVVDAGRGRPGFCLQYAVALSVAGRHAEATTWADRTHELYAQLKFDKQFYAGHQHRTLFQHLTWIYAHASERERAQAILDEWVEKTDKEDYGGFDEFLEEYPWLKIR